MNRKDLISKLISEGMTEKTLSNLTDKQIKMLSKRILSEQYSTPPTTVTTGPVKPVVNVKGTDTTTISNLKGKGVPFTTYEGEIKEDEPEKKPVTGATNMAVGFVNEDSAKAKKKEEDKKTVNDRLHNKIQHCIKTGRKYDSYIDLAKKVNDGKLPEKIQSLVVNEGFKKLPKDAKSLQEWVNKAVEKNYHPFTSKNEIVKLIETKLAEQEVDVAEPETTTLPDFLTFDAIKSSGGAEPTTKPAPAPSTPTTKPGTRPTPKTPFQPGPGPQHNPKAAMEEESK